MSDAATFVAVLAIKLALELVGRFSENDLLTGRHAKAAAGAMVAAAASIPIGRIVIAGGDNVAATAVVISAGVATWIGSRDLQRRKTD